MQLATLAIDRKPAPAHDEFAIRQFERVRASLFAWRSFWWLEHYWRIRDHIEERFRPVLKNDRLAAFALRLWISPAGVLCLNSRRPKKLLSMAAMAVVAQFDVRRRGWGVHPIV